MTPKNSVGVQDVERLSSASRGLVTLRAESPPFNVEPHEVELSPAGEALLKPDAHIVFVCVDAQGCVSFLCGHFVCCAHVGLLGDLGGGRARQKLTPAVVAQRPRPPNFLRMTGLQSENAKIMRG